MPRTRFARETEMLLPVLQATSEIAGPNFEWSWICELATGHGVPDLVGLRFLVDRVNERNAAGVPAITDRTELATLLALAREPADASELAAVVGISVSHLRRLVLPSLEDRELVERAKDRWCVVNQILPLADQITAVELKRRDWRAALNQARRYRSFATRVMVALEADVAVRLAPHASSLRQQRIGLMAVGRDHQTARVLSKPRAARPSSQLSFVLAAERAWAALSRGRIVDTVDAKVFGRSGLTASAVLPTLTDVWDGYLQPASRLPESPPRTAAPTRQMSGPTRLVSVPVAA